MKSNKADRKILRALRLESLWRGMSNAELADDIGLHWTDISRYRKNADAAWLKEGTMEKIKMWLDTLPDRPYDHLYSEVRSIDGIYKKEKGAVIRLRRFKAAHEAWQSKVFQINIR